MDDFERMLSEHIPMGNERAVRIFEEFVKTKEKLETQNIKNTIVMFGSARIKHDDKNEHSRMYYESARKLANRLASWSKETFLNKPPQDRFYICTGGGGGIMEAANKGASDAGEPTIGFNIKLPFEQDANPYIDKDFLFSFHYFFIRKFYFVFLAKAFVIFPGGFGTFDELFEIITLAQTQKMQKVLPFVIFGKEFYKNVLNFDMLLEHGFISESDRNLFLLTDDLDEAFEHITTNISRDKNIINFKAGT